MQRVVKCGACGCKVHTLSNGQMAPHGKRGVHGFVQCIDKRVANPKLSSQDLEVQQQLYQEALARREASLEQCHVKLDDCTEQLAEQMRLNFRSEGYLRNVRDALKHQAQRCNALREEHERAMHELGEYRAGRDSVLHALSVTVRECTTQALENTRQMRAASAKLRGLRNEIEGWVKPGHRAEYRAWRGDFNEVLKEMEANIQPFPKKE